VPPAVREPSRYRGAAIGQAGQLILHLDTSVVGLGDDARTAAPRIWSRPGRPSAGVPAVLIRSVTTNTHLTSASCLSGRHLLEPARVTRHRAKASAGR
jgi:hypothetical protein